MPQIQEGVFSKMYNTYPGNVSYSFGSKVGTVNLPQFKSLIGQLQNFRNMLPTMSPSQVDQVLAQLQSLKGQAEAAGAPTLKALLEGAYAKLSNVASGRGRTTAYTNDTWDDIGKAFGTIGKIIDTGLDLGLKVVDVLGKLGI